jgi:NADH-quinone oxidoreductase subunit E
VDYLGAKLRIGVGGTTEDGKFTLMKAECIAACEGAPAIRINDTLHRYISRERLDALLDELE